MRMDIEIMIRHRYHVALKEGGSPTLTTTNVPQALLEARKEWAAYQRWLAGDHGPRMQAKAIARGIGPQPVPYAGPRGIVEQTFQHQGHWLVFDVLTGLTRIRDFKDFKESNEFCAVCNEVLGVEEGQTNQLRSPILVFGSNLAGVHGAGAAKEAYEKWGAAWGQGEGRQGNSYAIPTKNAQIQTLPLVKVDDAVQRFLAYAYANPEETFLVSRVGCGLAGFTDKQIAPMFLGAPSNCWLPGGWPDGLVSLPQTEK